jgi:acetyl esterase
VPLDPRLEVVLALLAKETVDTSLSAAERRAAALANRASRGVSLVDPPPNVDDVRDASADGVPIRVYRPRAGTLPGLVFIHGGGWWGGSVEESDPTARRRAATGDCVVVSVEYRLAPEHPFPAGLDDCWTATKWVFEHAEELGIDPTRIAISGESAGGNLAAAVTLRARDAGGPQLVAQILEVPGMDLRMVDDDGSMSDFGDGYGFTRVALEECAQFYLGDQDRTQPLASPVFADVHDLPPALVTTCEYDPVRDSGEQYAAKLAAAGVPVTLRRWDGIAHGCGELGAILPEIAERYREEMAAFLRQAFARTTTDA